MNQPFCWADQNNQPLSNRLLFGFQLVFVFQEQKSAWVRKIIMSDSSVFALLALGRWAKNWILNTAQQLEILYPVAFYSRSSGGKVRQTEQGRHEGQKEPTRFGNKRPDHMWFVLLTSKLLFLVPLDAELRDSLDELWGRREQQSVLWDLQLM